MSARYEEDGYGWVNEQVEILRAGRYSEADMDHIIEEMESMSRGDRSQLDNRLAVLLHHLLKWRYQPARQGNSWRLTIVEQRGRLRRHLAKNPSLKPEIPDAIAESYSDGVDRCVAETGIDKYVLPETCPWSWEQVIDADFWPAS